MAFLNKLTHIKWSSTRHPRDERSPNTTSSAISIPGATKPSPRVPAILLTDDTGPGRKHHQLDTITDYNDMHPPHQATSRLQEQRISETEAQITSNRAPAGWTQKLGVAPPPGFGPRKVAVKKVHIVPEHLPPCMNKRDMNVYAWQLKMQTEARREAKRKRNAYVVHADEWEERSEDGDSGYESEERSEDVDSGYESEGREGQLERVDFC